MPNFTVEAARRSASDPETGGWAPGWVKAGSFSTRAEAMAMIKRSGRKGAKYRIKRGLGEMTMGKCNVKFQKSRLGPSAVLYDARGRSINLINYPKGTKLTKAKKARARELLCNSGGGLGGLDDGPVPWLAGAAALAGGLLVFKFVGEAGVGQ